MYSDQRCAISKSPLGHDRFLDNLTAVLDAVDNGQHWQGFDAVGFEGAIPFKNYHKMVQALRNVDRIPLAEEIIPEDLDLFSIFRLPVLQQNQNFLSESNDVVSKEDTVVALRSFLAGISRHYNNLLMGIQGNLSLILLSLKQNHPYLPIIRSAEELVQSGSFAISLLLGYLAERRAQTRKIRFKHLVKEAFVKEGYVPKENDRIRFEEWIKERPKLEGLAYISEKCNQSFNKLVRSVANWAEWIRLSGEVDAGISARLIKIKELTERGYWISSKLLAFASKGNFNLQRMSLRDVFDVSIEDFKVCQPTVELRLYHHRHHKIDILADPGHFNQVLLELLQNAAESMSNRGKITLSAKKLTLAYHRSKWISVKPGPYVMITIKDSGPGMDEKIKSKAFEPFFTTKTDRKALGLGLPMAYGVAIQLGGAIDIDSTPGIGTQVKLLLPQI
jgi:signal transduction histidine kinase